MGQSEIPFHPEVRYGTLQKGHHRGKSQTIQLDLISVPSGDSQEVHIGRDQTRFGTPKGLSQSLEYGVWTMFTGLQIKIVTMVHLRTRVC